MDRLLIVDDDTELCQLLARRLSAEDFALEAVHDGVAGLARALSREHDLVVLDLMLPGMKGLDVLRRLRAQSNVPVLILTARGEDVERILGLETGADDYLAKPFHPRELIARLRAILRRTSSFREIVGQIVSGDIRLDPGAREAWIAGRPLDLTAAEFSLLETMARNAGRVMSRDQLTQTVLGRRLGVYDRVIDVHVSNLRKKLGAARGGERIKAVRNAGYLFVERSEGG